MPPKVAAKPLKACTYLLQGMASSRMISPLEQPKRSRSAMNLDVALLIRFSEYNFLL